MKQARSVFTTEFKQECVRLIVDQGYGVGEASKAMDVGLSTLQRSGSGSIETKSKASHRNPGQLPP